MKLSKIYSNKKDNFAPIEFNEGLNVIIAEIRLPENKLKDTHNLGKTTLTALIDFCLLKEENKFFFLFKHKDIFESFVFFLEIKLNTGQYLTIKRPVLNQSKISFKKHKNPQQNFTFLPDSEWDHPKVSIKKAKHLLDSILGLTAVSPWTYRTAIGYSLRIQEDYLDVFKLDKFQGTQADWKPYLAKILGFNYKLCLQNYDLISSIEENNRQLNTLRRDLVGLTDDPDKLDGVILIKSNEVEKLDDIISQYDFEVTEADINRDLVCNIERKVASLNEQRYYISSTIEQIRESLEEKMIFNIDTAKTVFHQAKIYFGEQISKDFEDLIRFNKTITKEREQYLKEELSQLASELKEIETKFKLGTHPIYKTASTLLPPQKQFIIIGFLFSQE